MSLLDRNDLLRMFNPKYKTHEKRGHAVVHRYFEKKTKRSDSGDVLVRKQYTGSLESLQQRECRLLFDVSTASTIRIHNRIVHPGNYITRLMRYENLIISHEPVENLNENPGHEIVMKWHGFDLDDWYELLPLDENPFLCEAGFLLQMLQAAIEGLHCLYNLDLIHCDIKRDNLCLAFDFSTLQKTGSHWKGKLDPSKLKIIDLGLCFKSGTTDLAALPCLEGAKLNGTGKSQSMVDAFEDLAKGDARKISRLDWREDCHGLGFTFQKLLDTAYKSRTNLRGTPAQLRCLQKTVEDLTNLGTGQDYGGVVPPSPPYLDWLETIQNTLAENPPPRQWEFSVPRKGSAAKAGHRTNTESISVLPTMSHTEKKNKNDSPSKFPKWVLTFLLVILIASAAFSWVYYTGFDFQKFVVDMTTPSVPPAPPEETPSTPPLALEPEKTEESQPLEEGHAEVGRTYDESSVLVAVSEAKEDKVAKTTEPEHSGTLDNKESEAKPDENSVLAMSGTQADEIVVAPEPEKPGTFEDEELDEEMALSLNLKTFNPKSERPPLEEVLSKLAEVDAQRKEEEEQALRLADEIKKAEKKVDYTNSIGIKFVLIPAGSFKKGCDKDFENCEQEEELPLHQVKISQPFYLGKYEVTQAQWKAVMGNNPSASLGENLPVINVSYHLVQEFIRKLNQKEGHNRYRLPTEAEWEYAARTDSSTAYFWGNDKTQLKKYAWYNENSKTGTPQPVGLLQPNKWGLYDMYGNVEEWVEDWYSKNYCNYSAHA